MESKSSTGGSNKQTYILDADDFSSIRPGYELLLRLKEHFPKFKITLFTPAFHIKYFLKDVPMTKLEKWGRMVQEESDWLEIAPHGFAHLRGEWMTNDRKQIDMQLNAMENVFKRIGLKIIKVFKAPFWEYTEEVEKALLDRGYILAIDRNNPVVRTDIKTYAWNWSIDEPIPKYHTIKGHAHIWGTNNGIDKCFANLLKIPQDSEFKFISEFLCQPIGQQ